MERYLAVAPETLLQWLELPSDRIPSDMDAADSVNQFWVLRRARAWHEASPWELGKAKSRRTARNTVRSLCFAYRPRTQVVDPSCCVAVVGSKRAVDQCSTASSDLEHQLKLLRLAKPDRIPLCTLGTLHSTASMQCPTGPR